MVLFAVTIFVSAFLLFEMQPIIARIILPWFGGTAAVWTTCLLFFQVALLLGYLYAHWSIRYLKPRRQAALHLILLGLSGLMVAALRIMPRESWKPTGIEEPTGSILWLLLLTVGLPYFLLSTTGPLLQAWYAAYHARNVGEARPVFPYRLYALSNVGSMLALLSYPILVEPSFTIRQQSWSWSLGYGLFVFLCGSVAWRVLKAPADTAVAVEPESESGSAGRTGALEYLYWVALAACSCTLLLAVTTHLSQNVAAIPFLWVLPLSLYLLSFIVCFGGKGWRWKPAFLPIFAVALVAMTYVLEQDTNDFDIGAQIVVFSAGLFLGCMMCHGELARRKPPPRYLTAFYLMISLGGAMGGVFVGLLAPRCFSDYYELPLAIGASALFALFILYREHSRPAPSPDPALLREERGLLDPTWLTLAALTGGLLFTLYKTTRDDALQYDKNLRNFYGVLHVWDSTEEDASERTRQLAHGTITHGIQYLDPKKRAQPISYYGPDTGIGLAVREAQSRPVRIGVIGMGTGTMAAYARRGDYVRFYEINPLIPQLATNDFHFIPDARALGATVEWELGDARLVMERELAQRQAQQFDVLAVDAFSSDAIPVHLLTRQAFELYFRHLKPDGVLAVHVSNLYLGLAPVVAAIADSLDKDCREVITELDVDNNYNATEWVLVTARRSFFHTLLLKHVATKVERKTVRNQTPRLWTDDYSNLWQIRR